MRLDFNFNGDTHLREWWKQVYNNFVNIQKEFNENEDVWNNACTKEQVKEYIADIVNSNDDIISAMSNLKDAIENNQDVAETINKILNKRVPFEEGVTDADLCLNGIYTDISINTPEGQSGIIAAFDGIQLFLAHNDKNIFKRSGYNSHDSEWTGEWTALNKDIEEKIDECIQNTSGKQEKIEFGSYTGDDINTVGTFETTCSNSECFIELGFTPKAVEIIHKGGFTALIRDYDRYHFGGLAYEGYDCVTEAGALISIADNGFKIYNNYIKSKSGGTVYNKINSNNEVYYYKAYRA